MFLRIPTAVKINLRQQIKSVFNYKYNIKYSINTNNTCYIKQGSKSKKTLMSRQATPVIKTPLIYYVYGIIILINNIRHDEC